LASNATAAPDILGRRAPWNQQGKNCAPLVKISYNPKFTSVNRYRDALALSAVSTNGTDLRL
jgi:hypothetical protein